MKYIKPKSVTWWTGITNLAMGAAVATEPMHNAGAVVAVVNNLSGGADPHLLMTAGFGLIGLRGAL